MDILVSLTPESRTLAEKLGPGRTMAAVARGVTKATQLIHGFIIKERMTGKGPFAVPEHRLGVVTARLRQSFRWTPGRVTGNTVTSSIGSNVIYLGPHEFGFNGSVQVKAHERKVFHESGRPISSATVKRLVGKKAKRALKVTGQKVKVKAHARTMRIPERAPIRTGIQQHQGLFGTHIFDALKQEMGQTGADAK